VGLRTESDARQNLTACVPVVYPAIRQAKVADGAKLHALFQLEYRGSSHPFQTLDDVVAFLADSRNFAIVAEIDDQLVSAMAMTYCAWNDSFELGRAITHPDYRRHGLAQTLMQPVVSWVSAAALGEIFFGFPRARRIVDLCAALSPPMIVVGHDGGRNVAHDSRETHLIVYAIPSHADFEHIIPRDSSRFDAPLLAEHYYQPLGARPSQGPYPSVCFVGDAADWSIAFESFLIEYQTDSPHRALEIVGDSGRIGRTSNVAREIASLMRLLPDVEHVTATILADKIRILEALRDVGFDATAYLPAWYELEGRRYDCVQLSKRAHRRPASTLGFDDLLLRIDHHLQDRGAVAGSTLPSSG
jgi:N-acetylglutamate synthase-like GNAT family acetyltransferase